jgi:hypothetical protein
MMSKGYENSAELQEVYHRTEILRKPLTGIVSGYHELPYMLVSPDNENEAYSVRITGKINVSPRFIVTPGMLGERFGELFDPETFDRTIHGRLFSFAYHRGKNFKLESERFEVRNYEEKAQEHIDRLHDELMREENIVTALIFGPRFDYYPVSIDRFLTEILEREFRL